MAKRKSAKQLNPISNLFDEERVTCPKHKSHKMTRRRARQNRWFCAECGAPLQERQDKIRTMRNIAAELGFKIKGDE